MMGAQFTLTGSLGVAASRLQIGPLKVVLCSPSHEYTYLALFRDTGNNHPRSKIVRSTTCKRQKKYK